jgi:hypothetical protein
LGLGDWGIECWGSGKSAIGNHWQSGVETFLWSALPMECFIYGVLYKKVGLFKEKTIPIDKQEGAKDRAD